MAEKNYNFYNIFKKIYFYSNNFYLIKYLNYQFYYNFSKIHKIYFSFLNNKYLKSIFKINFKTQYNYLSKFKKINKSSFLYNYFYIIISV